MSNKGNVLIIDDEQNIREMLKAILEEEGYNSFTSASWSEANKFLLSEKIDVILLDIWLPETGGMEILDILKKDFSSIEVIMISGHGSIDTAVKSIKKGAFDFLEKPLSIDKILTVVENAYKIKKLKEENLSLRTTIGREYEMIGNSKAIENIRKIIQSAASTNSRVLITGENGTGKELIARAIHYQSSRAHQPFVEINCAAIPENLIESELFGYEKGAFTGAVNQKKGKFELANNGTIFLDEVADMSLQTQAKVLRVLEDMTFQRIGGRENIKIDVRVISATNKDIKKMVAEQTFREDLYYRLNVILIASPSLKERKEDIPLLVEHFLAKFSQETGRNKKKISNDAMEYIQNIDWPGNIRQLKNFVERVTVLVESENIGLNEVKSLLEHEIHNKKESILISDFKEKVDIIEDNLTLKDARDIFEKYFIEKVLKNQNYNISSAAAILDIERSNLHKKIKQLGITIERS